MRSSAASAVPISKGILAGRILTGLAAAFLLLDGTMKVVQARVSVEGTTALGYPSNVVQPLGILLVICTLLYMVPRTSILGAILLTGYLGGAVATNVRVANPLFSHTLFPIYVGAIVWGGLYLRDAVLRSLVPLRSESTEKGHL